MGKIQCALSHWNCPGRQTNGGQDGGSSDPSPQSSCPSHFHQKGKHFKVFSQRKLEAEQLDLQLKPSLCKMKFSGHWQTFSTPFPPFLFGTRRQRASQPPLFSQGLWTGCGCRRGWKTCSKKYFSLLQNFSWLDWRVENFSPFLCTRFHGQFWREKGAFYFWRGVKNERLFNAKRIFAVLKKSFLQMEYVCIDSITAVELLFPLPLNKDNKSVRTF